MNQSDLRIAIIQDFLVHMRGSERVMQTLSNAFPNADIFALVSNPEIVATEWRGRRVTTSFVDRLPQARRYYRALLPLYPYAVERFDLSAYDLVVSNSMGFAHGVLTQPGTFHVSICSSPLRYAWNFYHEFLKGRSLPQKLLFQLMLQRIRQWDQHAATRADQFIAISKITQQRLRKYYGREAPILHPPIDVSAFSIAEQQDDFFLIVSALMPYKRVDIAVKAFTQLGLRLKIIGTGPEAGRLMEMAGPTIEFLGWGSDREVRDAYARCQAFIMTADEDYGLTPLEAQASGRPVIAYGAGGVLETVRDGVTGTFFMQQTADALAETVRRFDTQAFDPVALRSHALEYDISAFERRLHDYVYGELRQYRSRYGLPPIDQGAASAESSAPNASVSRAQ